VKQEIGENIINYLLVKHMRFINSAKPLHQFSVASLLHRNPNDGCRRLNQFEASQSGHSYPLVTNFCG
jgi:hypothetical protein